MAKIARIQVIEEREATGTLKAYYEEMMQRRGRVPNIRKALSLKPEAMRAAELLGIARAMPPWGREEASESHCSVGWFQQGQAR
jgi:hypothetical protein